MTPNIHPGIYKILTTKYELCYPGSGRFVILLMEFYYMKVRESALVFLLGLNLFSVVYASSDTTSPATVWTATFYAQQARKDIAKPVSANFCITHTPNIVKTTLSNIKKGVQAENGVYIRYISYKTTYRHGLGFNEVMAELWTVDDKGNRTWHSPLWEYQQNLSDTGITNTVWATEQCKGKFIGISNKTIS